MAPVDGRILGDFSVNKTSEECEKRVEDHLGSLGFVADPDSAGSTTVFRESTGSGDDPSLVKTMLGVASNVLLSSSSGRGDSGNSRSVQVVILEEGGGTRLVIDASEPDLQKDLDEWVTTDLGGRPQD